MVKFNDPSNPPTDRPSELIQLVDADNQPMTETRKNREYPWLKKSIFLLALLCALILAGVVILVLQSQQQKNGISINELQQKLDISMNELQQKLNISINELKQKFDNSLKIYQNTRSSNISMNELQQKLISSMNKLKPKFNNSSKIYQNTRSNSSDKTLFYLSYENDDIEEGRICLFDSHTNSVEQIAEFTNCLPSHEVAATKNKIFTLGSRFEIFDLNVRQITRGQYPPEWRKDASVAYFKDKLYYLGGYTNRVDVLIDGEWQTGSAFPLPIEKAQTIICDEILYVIDGRWNNKKIYRLSDDEREWIEVGEIPGIRGSFGVASLNGRIYITGGWSDDYDVSESCLCFDPSAPVDSRISRIADMNNARYGHSLVAANGTLYAIGGFQELISINFCNSIEEYDPQTNEWSEVGKIT